MGAHRASMQEWWDAWRDSQPCPEDWTVPGISQRRARATLDEQRTHDEAVQESLDRRG